MPICERANAIAADAPPLGVGAGAVEPPPVSPVGEEEPVGASPRGLTVKQVLGLEDGPQSSVPSPQGESAVAGEASA